MENAWVSRAEIIYRRIFHINGGFVRFYATAMGKAWHHLAP